MHPGKSHLLPAGLLAVAVAAVASSWLAGRPTGAATPRPIPATVSTHKHPGVLAITKSGKHVLVTVGDVNFSEATVLTSAVLYGTKADAVAGTNPLGTWKFNAADKKYHGIQDKMTFKLATDLIKTLEAEGKGEPKHKFSLPGPGSILVLSTSTPDGMGGMSTSTTDTNPPLVVDVVDLDPCS